MKDKMLAMGVGFAAGALTALMLTPTSGEETRRKLGQFTQKVGDTVGSGVNTVKSKLTGNQPQGGETMSQPGQPSYGQTTTTRTTP